MIHTGDIVRLNKKGLETPSTDDKWLDVIPARIEELQEANPELTVKLATYDKEGKGYLKLENDDMPWCWPAEMFELANESRTEVELTRKELALVKQLLEEHIEQYQDLLAKFS